jgi:CheY-like chemotaxis protein
VSSSAPVIVGRGTTAEPSALIVEDDAAVRRALARILKEDGFVVATSESGEHALDRVRRGERFELVVSDVEMGGMDGPAFCEAARSVWAEIDAVIVFATGRPRVLEAATSAARDGSASHSTRLSTYTFATCLSGRVVRSRSTKSPSRRDKGGFSSPAPRAPARDPQALELALVGSRQRGEPWRE